MKTLYRYLYKELLTISLLTIGVLTFFFIILNIPSQVFDLLLSRDVSVFIIAELILLLVPFALIFTLPWGLLMGVMLVFGRLSQDNEILSLKSSGVGLAPVIAPAIILSLIFSGISFWINASLGPESRSQFKLVLSEVVKSNPLALFNNQQVIDTFDGYRIFIGQRHGGDLEKVQIWKIDNQFRPLKSIRADRATFNPDLNNQRILLTLFNTREEDRSPDHLADVSRIHSGYRAQEAPFDIQLPSPSKNTQKKSNGDQTLGEIGQQIFNPVALLKEANMTPVLTEIQKRIAWSLSSFTFVLVGIPLALQVQRRETSIGLALSLGIVLVYYAIFIVADSMKQQAKFFPELIIWLPNLVFQSLGFFLLIRANRR